MVPGSAPQPVTARVLRLSLRNVRSYERLEAELAPGLAVIAGPNGVGKTNLLEALAMACLGASPRTSSELRVVREGEPFARIAADVEVSGRASTRVVVIEHARGKRLEVDGAAVQGVEAFAAGLPAVTFLPERLLVVRGAPARRRQLLDRLVARLLPGAAAIQRRYGAATVQRNALLRRARAGADVRDAAAPWTAQLVEFGEQLRSVRCEVLEALEPCFRQRFENLTGFDDGRLVLHVRGDDDLAAALAASWELDVRRGSTTVGPHLDDLDPHQGRRDLRSHGSTGEQRAALLAWSLAEADLLRDRLGIEPLLVFDEPYAELDRTRRRLLSDELRSVPQAVVTTTEPPGHLVTAAAGGAAVSLQQVASGTLIPWTTTPDIP